MDTEFGKTGSPHVKWMSVVAVEVFRASRPAADLMTSQGALQRSSEDNILAQRFSK
jgi:hypothetical protein